MKHYFAALLLLAACAAPPDMAPPPQDDGAWYLKAAQAGLPVYRIDPAESLIAVTVRSSGAFARFGHDHVVASRNIAGFAAPAQGRAHFQFRLDEMTVDEPALRQRAGLPPALPPDAVEGTRANMLGRVLDAARYPLVQLRVQRIAGAAGTLRLAVTLHGTTRSVDVPAKIEQGPDTITASGAFTLRQSDFEIVPMSVLGGALAVRDAMELEFRIQSRRLR